MHSSTSRMWRGISVLTRRATTAPPRLISLALIAGRSTSTAIRGGDTNSGSGRNTWRRKLRRSPAGSWEGLDRASRGTRATFGFALEASPGNVRRLSTSSTSSTHTEAPQEVKSEEKKSHSKSSAPLDTPSIAAMGNKPESSGPRPGKKPPPSIPFPSASVILISPENEVLLLHRVEKSRSFPSAHVFPGGNLSRFHEGALLAELENNDARHVDGPAYRLAAIRETFEESGILLARRRDGKQLLRLPDEEMQRGRKAIHAGQVRFEEWLESVGGVPDTENLIPFTRWITPPNLPRRYTTQMYLYLLPRAQESGGGLVAEETKEVLVPTDDGGAEVIAAAFAPPAAWIAQARTNDIILFPPQMYLLELLARFLGQPSQSGKEKNKDEERASLLAFLNASPSATGGEDASSTSAIPWADKVMSPRALMMLPDGRSVLGLDHPGPELRGSGRGGDAERVVLVRFTKAGPRDVEVRRKKNVFAEQRAAAAATDNGEKGYDAGKSRL